MFQLKNNKGITLISLVITVIILTMTAVLVINNGVDEVKFANEKKALSEVEIVNQAVFQAYSNYFRTKNTSFIVGEVVEAGVVSMIATEIGVTLVTIPENSNEILKEYYRLTPENLEKIGVYESEDTYIVNYLTGEVINETDKKTSTGKPLYTYSVNSFVNDVTAF